MSTTPSKPRVALIGTGGTISSIALDSLDVLDYPDVSRKMKPAEIVERTPELARFAELVPINFREVGSTAIGPADWLELLKLIHATEAGSGGFDGYVILHGTSTLEETAYFLSRVLTGHQPVVLTCAMRPASALSPDGPQNLLDALTVSRQAQAGVFVVCGGCVHSAAYVQKVHPYRLDAFSSGDAGPVGFVEEGRVRWTADSWGPKIQRPVVELTAETRLFFTSSVARLHSCGP